MSTRSIVSLIKRQAPDYTRVEILDLVNDVVQIMLRKPTSLTRMFDESGTDPVLTTIAGTKKYELSLGSTCFNYLNGAFFVAGVYSGKISTINNSSYAYPNDSVMAEVYIQNATGAKAATVTFLNDPGTSTYYVKAYAQPLDLTSESMDMPVPVEWQLPCIMDGVIGLIEKAEHGKSDRWDVFYNNTLPDFWGATDITGNNITLEVPECY
jgi:hypothetical protein